MLEGVRSVSATKSLLAGLFFFTTPPHKRLHEQPSIPPREPLIIDQCTSCTCGHTWTTCGRHVDDTYLSMLVLRILARGPLQTHGCQQGRFF